MTDVFANLGLGFAVALTVQNIGYCFLGVLLGTIIGVLPGIGPVTTVAMLLPVSFTLAPESALILLAGIWLLGARSAAGVGWLALAGNVSPPPPRLPRRIHRQQHEQRERHQRREHGAENVDRPAPDLVDERDCNLHPLPLA